MSAALRAFAEAGYRGVTLLDVARRAGVPASAVRAAFPSKDDLFRETVRAALVGAQRTLGPAMTGGDDTTADGLRIVARRFWDAMERPPLAVLLRLTVSELPRFPELAVFYATEVLERFLHEIERLIARGVARGEVGAVDVRATARTVLAALSAYAWWFGHPAVYAGLVGLDREAAEARAVECLLRMLRAPAVRDEINSSRG